MTTQHTGQHPTRRTARRILVAGGGLLLALTTAAGVAAAGVVSSGRSLHQAVPATSPQASATSQEQHPEPRRGAGSHPRRPLVVAFVVGRSGTIASDLLAPYDILASSPWFDTYVVAERAAPAPLEGGPAVVPTYTFGDIDADPSLKPDLVVVPGLTDPTGSTEAPLRSWVAGQRDDGAQVLGVCTGSLVLAATGMLDGLRATSHWSRIDALEEAHPSVDWVRGRTYVEDGSVTTTGAVASGVPAALHLVATVAGATEAQRVADLHPELGWTPTQPTTVPEDHFQARDWPVLVNYVMPWFRPTIGVFLRNGVGELDATAAFEVYSQSAAGSTVALGTTDAVRTRHGLVLLTTSLSRDPRVSRVVVPGTDEGGELDTALLAWADSRALTIEPLAARRSQDGASMASGGFSAALENLAEHTDATTATTVAKMIGYPTTDLDTGDQHRPLRPVLLGTSTLALAVLVGLAPTGFMRRRRRQAHLSRATSTRPTAHVEATT